MSDVLNALSAYARYEPETGHFIRLRTTASNARAGDVCGALHRKGYRVIRLGNRSYRANRLAWLWMTGSWPAGQVDHRNGVRDDDRWENLRLASNSQNCANARRRADNTSGAKGVKPLRGKWQARIGAGGKNHLGTFATLEEARAAYASAASRLYGDFARSE